MIPTTKKQEKRKKYRKRKKEKQKEKKDIWIHINITDPTILKESGGIMILPPLAMRLINEYSIN